MILVGVHEEIILIEVHEEAMQVAQEVQIELLIIEDLILE
jgi:hypothetical protein